MKNCGFASFARFARAFSIFARCRPFQDVKLPVLQLCRRREHLTTKFSILSSYLGSAYSNLIPGYKEHILPE